MDNIKKIEVVSAAVEAAEKNGFDFQAWYMEKLNIGSSWGISTFERIKHMCYLGIEELLILNKKFAKALNKRNWMPYLTSAVVKESPINFLWEYLVKNGILEE